MIDIPLSAIPAQSFTITLNEQNCRLKIYTRGARTYMDLYVDGEAVRQGMLCLSGTRVLQYKTADFDGDFFFVDFKSEFQAPYYTGFDDRFRLFYFTSAEMEDYGLDGAI